MSMQSEYEQAIASARKHFAAARTIERNQRLRRYHGRNSRATEDTLAGHYEQAERATRGCSREVRGLLHVEHELATRVSGARDDKQLRPELRARLAVIRRALATARS